MALTNTRSSYQSLIYRSA